MIRTSWSDGVLPMASDEARRVVGVGVGPSVEPWGTSGVCWCAGSVPSQEGR